jgi:polar amino acid transport system substrate-binding protein
VTRATRFGLIALLLVAPARQARAQPHPPLVWGCDPEGGAPYVEADPSDPSRQAGFEVDIANLVAAHLRRQAKFSFVAFSSINQSLRRGDFDVSFCGLEEITAHRTAMAATLPYYQFREVLTVRAAD